MLELLQPHIRQLKMYEGVDPTEVLAQKAGIPNDKVIRLNGNENPYGPSPAVSRALGNYSDYNRYPDPEQRVLREALSSYLGIGLEYIVAGNGSDELIDLTLRMVLGPGEKMIEPDPTFGMYAVCAQICGGKVVVVPRTESFDIDLEATDQAIDAETKAILVASPNNPTGNTTPEAQIKHLLEMGILVVVDETYYEFCGKTALPLVKDYPNLVVLRTFSKWAGLAGLRMGLGVMNPDIAKVMMAVKPPYNVNLAAELALLASLEDLDHLLDRVRSIVAERQKMHSQLEKIPGLVVWPSDANFILCRFPQDKGQDVINALAMKGIFVRYFSNKRMKDHARISVGLPHETDALVEALVDIMKEIN